MTDTAPVGVRSLEGACAVVTGAGAGIGAATARALAAAGARVVVADIDEAGGEDVARQVGGRFEWVDVRDPAGVRRLFDAADAYAGPLRVAHLNAGIRTGHRRIADLGDDEYLRVLETNVSGVVFGVREALVRMTPEGCGAIVVTASLSGLTANSRDPVEALTKHAVVGFSRGVAPIAAASGIAVHCICPGIVDTGYVDDVARAQFADQGFPLIPPDDIAALVVSLATADRTGEAWVCQPGREPLVYEFRGVPGPRAPGAEGMRPVEIRR